jgi:hypothetical protein
MISWGSFFWMASICLILYLLFLGYPLRKTSDFSAVFMVMRKFNSSNTLAMPSSCLSFAHIRDTGKSRDQFSNLLNQFSRKTSPNWTYKFGHRRVGLGDFVKPFAPLSYFSFRFSTSPLLCCPPPPPPRRRGRNAPVV